VNSQLKFRHDGWNWCRPVERGEPSGFALLRFFPLPSAA